MIEKTNPSVSYYLKEEELHLKRPDMTCSMCSVLETPHIASITAASICYAKYCLIPIAFSCPIDRSVKVVL